ncbi:DUF6671 family protein [Acidovorax sp. RAC01]|uniref:DUF6671 family protein n=1 Tax=Acidovorax sp. RAC01 TaxID=1842533 RepID=UPI00083E83E2|nr:DUF6671 family protein [Acidovorax sp. RAC01]AOG25339.1 hypothetical protein BSY15_809 [Acidovorax sp. RAC01]
MHPARYQNQKIAFLTQHGKQTVIAAALEPALGCTIEHVTGYDTDLLGTFTRELSRPGTQLDAARRKARKGMELSGLPLGLASEGSFGPDPFTGMFPWNVEMLVLIDDVLGIEIVGVAQGPARNGCLLTGSWQEAEAFAAREGFPEHHLVMRPEGQDDTRIHKGISSADALRTCFDECLALSHNGKVWIETDLRAFANPSRMKHIAQAADDLCTRLQATCPACAAPGYGITGRQPGLPCEACGQATSSYRSQIWTCVRCRHQAEEQRTDRVVAEARHCARCNP